MNVSYDLSITTKLIYRSILCKETKDLRLIIQFHFQLDNLLPENIGTMENSGLELEAGWMAYDKDDLSISLNANLSTLKNELTELPKDSIQVGNFRRVVGKSIYDYYMVRSAGVNPDNGTNISQLIHWKRGYH